MSKIIYRTIPGLFAISLLLLTGCTATMDQHHYQDRALIDDVEYLAEYGEWADHPEYGGVWFPYVVDGWRPFSNGHWIWTNSRWAWTSYEPFGWLVYHYGYWGYEPSWGWFWVPDDIWEPARVEWYNYGDYAGWAPLPPPGMVWPDPWVQYDIDIWIIVHQEHFMDEDIGRRIVTRPVYAEREWRRRDRNAPDVRRIEETSKRRIPSVKVRERRTLVRPKDERDRTTRRRIDLPKTEERRVEKHRPRVKREVLKREEPTRKKRKKEPEKKKTEPKRKRR